MINSKGLNVVSLFDGIGGGAIALTRSGIKINKYYSSEIDKYALQVNRKNFPDSIELGDVENWRDWDIDWKSVDLVIGGSPCQGFSKAGNGLNFHHEKSKLFFVFVDILNHLKKHNPDVKFLLENVRMKQEWQDVISDLVGAKPVMINSSIVSAQNRVRLYWTNITGYEIPEDKNILLENIIQSGEVDRDKSYCIDANYFKGINIKTYLMKSRRQIVWEIPEATKKGFIEVSEGQGIDLTFIKSKTRRGRLMLKKSNCLTASNYNYCIVTKDWFRLFTPIECERLQTIDDDFTKYGLDEKGKTIEISNSQRKKMLGNGWTIDIICIFFDALKN